MQIQKEIDNNAIRNIIFDLGGVILNIDYRKTEQAFNDLGVTEFRKLYSQFHASDLFINLETGRISPRGFIEEIKRYSSTKLSDNNIKQAWNAMLMDFPQGRLNFLNNIKRNYRTFLLSNTNEIHYNAIQENYSEVMKTETPLDGCFEKVYYSHQMGMRKPDKEVFEYVLYANHLDPAETLFIDDTFTNVEGALKTGINGLYLSTERIEDLFSDFKLTASNYLTSSKSI